MVRTALSAFPGKVWAACHMSELILFSELFVGFGRILRPTVGYYSLRYPMSGKNPFGSCDYFVGS